MIAVKGYYRPETGDGLFGPWQAHYFAIIRADMESYTASRIMEMGRDKEAEEIFQKMRKEIIGH